MAFRFWRRVKLAPGVTLNLSKSGGSLSFGPRGAKFTLGGRGGPRATAGIPGTGLFYTVRTGGGRRRARAERAEPDQPRVPAASRLDLGFFQRLFTPADEKRLVEGLRELALGSEESALRILDEVGDRYPDAAWLAGTLAFRLGRREQARGWLERLADDPRGLGTMLRKYGVSAITSLAVTEEVTVHLEPGRRGALLVLVELHQQEGRLGEAVALLEELRRLEPGDPLLRLSLAELLLERGGEGDLRRVDRLGRGVENEGPLEAALLLYRGRALRLLGLPTAARELLTTAFRRKKDRPAELLLAIQYERALAYAEEGKRSRHRQELERIYLEDAGYADVAERLRGS